MAIQFRSLFPLALPGMLALLGWWWFFSRKKEPTDPHHKAEAVAAEPRAKSAVQEAPPAAHAVAEPPEKDPSAASRPAAEPPALLRAQPVRRRSESSGNLPNTTDSRSRPGLRKDEGTKVELALTGDEAKSGPLERHPKALAFPHEASEVRKRESARTPGQAAACAEKRGPGDKARETGGTEGTGDAVAGESVPDEGLPPPQERGREPQNSKGLCPRAGEGEKGQGGPPRADESGGEAGRLLSGLLESAHAELAKDGGARGGDRAGEPGREGAPDSGEQLEQAAYQIISKVIMEATEEILASTVGKITGRLCQEEGRRAPRGRDGASGPGASASGPEGAEGSSVVVRSPPPAEDPLSPKTYVSCLTSPLSSPAKDKKTKTSVHHISLAPRPPQASPLGGPPEEPAEEAHCAACAPDGRQGAPSTDSSGPCSDSVSTSGLEDSGAETGSTPSNKAGTPPLPDGAVPFSNGVLKEALSDLGTEDGWTMDAEADHSGGSDGNSMDSVDGCCGLRKTDGFQNAQAGSNPKKVDLIIWEIEVPKHLVGRLIGKQGRYVSFLKQTSGAKIYISTLPYTQNIQICHIEGSQHHVDKALNLIGKKFKELNLTNIYAPPLPSLPLPSLPMTSWLMLPDGITVEVIVVNQVNAGHLFVQQHTHPTFHALRSLDQQMYLCYSQPGIPTLPTPVEITVICAAPGAEGAWWRAQVVASYEETDEVEIRYVDYGGYKRVRVDALRQIRSDFVTLPFQGAEVLLDSVMPLSDDDHFSAEADAAMSEMTGNTALLAQVTSYSPTGLPLVQLWSVLGDEVVLINRSLVERGLAQWVDSYYASL